MTKAALREVTPAPSHDVEARPLWSCGSRRRNNHMCYGHGGRRYFTREERKAWLEDYAKNLENELKAVRERITEISQASG